ncbi:hypothetical protein D3C80_1136420 [compost metagenome]
MNFLMDGLKQLGAFKHHMRARDLKLPPLFKKRPFCLVEPFQLVQILQDKIQGNIFLRCANKVVAVAANPVYLDIESRIEGLQGSLVTRHHRV